MNRYVVKHDKVWKVVNAGYKRSIKNFKTQAEAVDFARELLGTTSLYVQGRDHKFIRHYHEKARDEGTQVSCTVIPRYVMKHSDEYEQYMITWKRRLLAQIGIFLTIVGLIFMILWIIELQR